MRAANLVRLRHEAQLIGVPGRRTAEEVVTWLGAVQAQDLAAAKWAIGVRLGGGDDASDAAVERAIDGGRIIRIHALRGTWQLLAAPDVRWIIDLVSPQVLAGWARRLRELELDGATLSRAMAVLERDLALGDRTRAELAAALEKAGVSPAGQRLSHLLGHAELIGLAAGGPRRKKQPTWSLLDQRVRSEAKALSRVAALEALARRYFASRGPAGVDDFGWWSGLRPAEARAAHEAARPALSSVEVDGRTLWFDGRAKPSTRSLGAHLLPAFDEYLVGYTNRDLQLDPAHVRQVNAGGGLLAPIVVVAGAVVGCWRRLVGRAAVEIELSAFGGRATVEGSAIAVAAERYARFLGLPPKLSIGSGDATLER
jgi:hypothetical protein